MIIDTSGMPPVLARRFEDLARAIEAGGRGPVGSRGLLIGNSGRRTGLRFDMHAARSMFSQVQCPTKVGQILVCTKSGGEPDYRWVRFDPPNYDAVLCWNNTAGDLEWIEVTTECP